MAVLYPTMVIRVIHTGVFGDGRPNPSSIGLYDLDVGEREQTGSIQKVPIYVPFGGFIEVPLSSKSFLSLVRGSLKKFIDGGLITVEQFFRFRDFGNIGGDAGLGVTLKVGVNVERTAGVARFVLDKGTESVGYIKDERVTVAGLTGVFAELNDTYFITAIADNENLVGPDTTAYTISVESVGANIPAGPQAGALLTLPDFKTTVLFAGSGFAAGFGSDIYGYVGGLPIPHDIGGGGGGTPGIGTFRQTFSSADLAGGVLNVNHNLGFKFNVIEVWDETDQRILPDFETALDTNNIAVNLSSYSPISGSWNVIVISFPSLRFVLDFTSGDLAAGILTVTHNFGEQYNVIQIWDDSDQRILPDFETSIDSNTIDVDLSSFGTIAGTWRAVVLG